MNESISFSVAAEPVVLFGKSPLLAKPAQKWGTEWEHRRSNEERGK